MQKEVYIVYIVTSEERREMYEIVVYTVYTIASEHHMSDPRSYEFESAFDMLYEVAYGSISHPMCCMRLHLVLLHVYSHGCNAYSICLTTLHGFIAYTTSADAEVTCSVYDCTLTYSS